MRKFPKNIEKQIRDYLALEFGESDDNSDSIKVSDLKFEGEHEIEGALMSCWSFPSINQDTWAVVEGSGDSYSIGLASNPYFSSDVTYEYVWIEIWEKKGRTVKVPLIKYKDALLHFENEFRIKLKSGRDIVIYVEIKVSTSPYEYTVSLLEGETGITFNAESNGGRSVTSYGETKGIVDYVIDEFTGIKIAVGGEKWF